MNELNNIEQLIIRYYSDKLSPIEEVELLDALEKRPEYKKIFFQYKETSDQLFQAHNPVKFDINKAYQKVRKVIFKKNSGNSTKVIPLSYWVSFTTVAASIFIAWLLFKPSSIIEIKTVVAEKQQIELNDGSVITLNEYSHIKYPRKIKKGQKERRVSFSGEAFFEIKTNPSQPFIVETDKIIVEVKGTSFNVLQDSIKGIIVVSVIKGNVGVLNKTDSLKIEVKEGEKAVYNYNQKALKKEVNTSLNANSWKTGILVFRDTPLSTVIEEIKQYYKVNIIIINDDIKDCKLDTRIDNSKFNEVIEMLELIFGFKIEQKDSTYYITGQGC